MNKTEDTNYLDHETTDSINKTNGCICKNELTIKRTKLNHFLGLLSTYIPLLISFLGLIFTIYQFSEEQTLQRKFQEKQRTQVQISQKIQSIETQIQNKISKRDELNNALSKSRNIVEISYLHCNDNNLSDSDNEIKFNEKKINNLFQTVNAIYSISQIYNQEIYNQGIYFLKLMDENKNPCSGDKDFTIKLRLLQTKINNLMNVSLLFDKQEKNNLLSQLANSSK